MADRTIPQRVARYEEKQRATGLVRVHVWVPADKAEELKRIAAEMRESSNPDNRS